MTDVEKMTEIEAGVRRCGAMVASMDNSLGKIEADLVVLQGSYGTLPRAVLLWFTLAAVAALLAMCIGG